MRSKPFVFLILSFFGLLLLGSQLAIAKQPTDFQSLLLKPSDCTASNCPSGVYVVGDNDGQALYDLGTLIGGPQNSHPLTAGMTGEWSNQRYAILIKPGKYAMPAPFKLNYYTEVSGLGKTNSQTIVSPGINALNYCDITENPLDPSCKTIGGLNNFWRAISNLTINVQMPDKKPLRWAVSQASPMRDMNIIGDLLLCDWMTPDWSCGYTSGGFMANTNVTGEIISGSQQQWLTRNANFAKWDGGLWNMNFVGATGHIDPPTAPIGVQMPSKNPWINYPESMVTQTPVIAEKPHVIFTQNKQWQVLIPGIHKNVSGLTSNDSDQTRDINQKNFYIITPSSEKMGATSTLDKTTIDDINKALQAGKSLIVMPGVYLLEGTIIVPDSNNTRVILGLGLPNFACMGGKACMIVKAREGVRLAGIVFGAGYEKTDTLLQMGTASNSKDNSANPNILSDIFCRVAETQLTKRVSGQTRQTNACLTIYTNNVVGDNLWLWRGDHDKASGDSPKPVNNLVSWTQNLAQYGLIVYGKDVTIYGLAVEHFQNYQTVWLGEGGRVYFYQSEMPYNVPSLKAWSCSLPDGTASTNGCASYVVGPNVHDHQASGLGIYSYFPNSTINAPTAILAPERSGITFSHMITRFLNGQTKSGINSILSNGKLCWGPSINGSSDKKMTAAMGVYNATTISQGMSCQR